MTDDLSWKQKLALKRVLAGREKIVEARRNAALYVAVAVDAGVSVRRLSKETGLTRQRIYQMRDAGRAQLDQ